MSTLQQKETLMEFESNNSYVESYQHLDKENLNPLTYANMPCRYDKNYTIQEVTEGAVCSKQTDEHELMNLRANVQVSTTLYVFQDDDFKPNNLLKLNHNTSKQGKVRVPFMDITKLHVTEPTAEMPVTVKRKKVSSFATSMPDTSRKGKITCFR
mmetsp:Transcript_11617/g.15805  ORF Transcript_11617/g.15805 Transcript_11617/m.15805 type:complete len:155 (+) Transcript_11617:129-593(+)